MQDLLILSEKCQNQLHEGLCLYSGALEAVVDGSIEVCVLELVLKNQENFLELSKHGKYTDNKVIPESGYEALGKIGVLGKILQWRKNEL